MSGLRELYYSPVCDIDREAYIAYLIAVRNHGSSTERIAEFDGPASYQQYNCCFDNSGKHVACATVGVCSASKDELVGSINRDAGVGSESGVIGDSVEVGQRGSTSIGRLAIGCFDTVGFRPSGCVFDDPVSDDKCHYASFPSGKVVTGQERGKNFERNKRNRDAKKRKEKKQKIESNWRSSADKSVVTPGFGSRVGFFSECDPSVRAKLRDSRARFLVAENERKAKEEECKIRRMDSPETIIAEMIRITGMTNRLIKQTEDSKVGSWAKTVSDSLTRSVAESAPSSVPSLESVGYGKSALKSSDGSSDVDVSKKTVRRTEYEFALAEVEKAYDDMDSYAEDDYAFSVRRVKQVYSDVAYSVDELAKQSMAERVAGVLLHHGFGSDKIEESLEQLDLKCDY